MIRLTALNDDSSRSSEDDNVYPKEPPLEIQEENALKLYNEALTEQRSGHGDKAEELYKQLLLSNLLMKTTPDDDCIKGRKSDLVTSLYSKPSLMLKYSCLKNLAVISQKKNSFFDALNYYKQALDVEGTDVTMWFQCGCVALSLFNLNIAVEAFLKGLEFSPKHWPSLDKLIICLFVLHDYINCLHFISKAFEIDVKYTRGHILRDYIINKQPSIVFDIKYFFPRINLHLNTKNIANDEINKKLLDEVLRLYESYKENNKTVEKEEVQVYVPSQRDRMLSWSSLGETILQAYDEITNHEKHISLLMPINLKKAFSEAKLLSEKNNEPLCGMKTLSESECPNKISDDENQKDTGDSVADKKNKKNKGSALMEELLWGGKRRSARVRSSLRGNPEPMDVAEALRRILPRKLLHKTKQLKMENGIKTTVLEEDSMDTMDLYKLFEKQESAEEKKQKEEIERSEVEHDIDKVVEGEGYFGNKAEEDDVTSFIESENEKYIIELIKSFVMALKFHWKKTWPNSLPGIYIRCYQLMREHYPMEFQICTTETGFKNLVEESGSVLLYGELIVEHSSLPRTKDCDEIRSNTSTVDIIFLQNIMELTDRKEMFENEEIYFEFLLRLYWLRCRLFLEKGQTTLAIVALNDVLACYELFPQFECTVIHLKNCRKHNVISKTLAEEFLAYQSRKRSLAEVVRLYEDESYEELTEILKDTFTTTPDTINTYFREHESELVDRQTQLSMLINGLYHLNEYKECIYWLETCCYEILQKTTAQLLRFEEEGGETWMVIFDRFLVAIEDCLKLGKTTITEALPPARVSRFVQTICHAICKELEDSDRPPCPARPWIMLNTILVGLERQGKPEVLPGEEEEEENDIPSSILILFTAHEYLGRREWCNCNDSVLLYLIMDQVIPRLRKPDWVSFRETIQQHLEQVIYCLYCHPNKKSKARYLTEHNVNSVPLTWQRGIQLFELFRPDETPSYDSLRVNLISSETEVLFRRIAALIPDDKDPVQFSDKMTEFIVGKINDVPVTYIDLPDAVKDLFYILGDYYFKTHEFAKAVNYLLMDLCANSDRVDSWASMALSRASLLEQQLNSCDPLKDEGRYDVFLQDALSALRCYEHCLQLDNKQCALWIEYGSFVYTIHSFCSQRMKLESFSLSLEQFEELESTKNKMLETAKQAFLNANLIWYEMKEDIERQDERWLHHYMLGKICEKDGDFNYLDHYEKASELLYENEAEFPSKVGYTAPQTLAIEALEIYYRVHVCVIKTLELNEGKPLDTKTRQLFNKHLSLCAKGPFAKQLSKGDLAKLKAKEAEATNQEKAMKVIKAVMNDLITVIEKADNKVPLSACNTEDGEVEMDSSVEVIDSEFNVNLNRKSIENEIRDIGGTASETGIFNKEPSKTSEKTVPENPDNIKLKTEEIIITDCESRKPEVPFELENQKCDKESSGNSYITLEDLKKGDQPSQKSKKKRRPSQVSLSSSSCESNEVRYDDDSSSSSSSSQSSGSSDSSSSSSSSESIQSHSDATNKEASKATDDEEKQSESEKDKTSEESAESEEKKGDSKSDFKNSETFMLLKCLTAFETCALRFPQHYKSIYRLAHFYFRSKEHRDLSKCRDLLLGRYQTPKGTILGLFSERKNTNFFNGIWRIPAGDVDRPGSFASHMSRSILLLMEVLRDSKDHKMLLEISLQLRKTPEPDKKYLREDERNQLAAQACDLAIQTLRKNVKESSVMTLPMVLDCYRSYQKVQKHYPHKESIYGDLLLEAFKRLGRGDKCTLDQAIRFCQAEVSTVRNKVPKALSMNQPSTPKLKLPKVKKREKKNWTAKPQMVAKAVPKISKPKKSLENKKNAFNFLSSNLAMDPSYWSTLMKTVVEAKSVEPSKFKTNAQMYSDILRTIAVPAKQMDQLEKQITDHVAMKNAIDLLKSDLSQKVPQETTKSNIGLFQQHGFSDQGNEKFKSPGNKFWGNSPLPSNVYTHMQNIKKANLKPTKQQSVLKHSVNKQELIKSDETKTKTNFNIEDILGKPNIAKPPPCPSSSLMRSIEEKIKSISKEVNITKCSTGQAINLSTSRKNLPEQGKRPYAEPQSDTTIKKICRPSDQGSSSGNRDDIEVVVIDD